MPSQGLLKRIQIFSNFFCLEILTYELFNKSSWAYPIQIRVKFSCMTYKNFSIFIVCELTPILHTWFRDSCFTCDGSPTIQVFPLIFYIGMVI
jgi:hypothetical protein